MKKIVVIICMMLLSMNIFAQLKAGDKAPEFKLKNVDSKMVSFADFDKAKGFIVVFTCNGCPYAKAYEERILEIDKQYSLQGYPVIAVNPNDITQKPEDSFAHMVKLHKKKKYTFPYLFDATQTTAKAYGATHTPHIFLIQKDKDANTFTIKYTGGIDDNGMDVSKVSVNYLKDAVEELTRDKEITVKNSKTIGCTIKWKKG